MVILMLVVFFSSGRVLCMVCVVFWLLFQFISMCGVVGMLYLLVQGSISSGWLECSSIFCGMWGDCVVCVWLGLGCVMMVRLQQCVVSVIVLLVQFGFICFLQVCMLVCVVWFLKWCIQLCVCLLSFFIVVCWQVVKLMLLVLFMVSMIQLVGVRLIRWVLCWMVSVVVVVMCDCVFGLLLRWMRMFLMFMVFFWCVVCGCMFFMVGEVVFVFVDVG